MAEKSIYKLVTSVISVSSVVKDKKKFGEIYWTPTPLSPALLP